MNSSEKWTALSSDATGVRVLPRDTNGYIVDGMACSYRIARLILDLQARTYPDRIPELAAEARSLNAVHLHRLLGQQPRVFQERATWNCANLPRRDRRVFENEHARRFGWYSYDDFSARTLANILREKKGHLVLPNFHSSKAQQALEKAIRPVPPAPP